MNTNGRAGHSNGNGRQVTVPERKLGFREYIEECLTTMRLLLAQEHGETVLPPSSRLLDHMARRGTEFIYHGDGVPTPTERGQRAAVYAQQCAALYRYVFCFQAGRRPGPNPLAQLGQPLALAAAATRARLPEKATDSARRRAFKEELAKVGRNPDDEMRSTLVAGYLAEVMAGIYARGERLYRPAA